MLAHVIHLVLPHLAAKDTKNLSLTSRDLYKTMVALEARHFLASKDICPWSQPFDLSWKQVAEQLIPPEKFKQIPHLDLNLHQHTPFRPSPLSLLSESAQGHFTLVEEEEFIHEELWDTLVPDSALICDAMYQDPTRVRLEQVQTSIFDNNSLDDPFFDLTTGTRAKTPRQTQTSPQSPSNGFSFFAKNRQWTFTLPNPKKNEYRVTAKAYTLTGCAVLVKSKTRWLLVLLEEGKQTTIALPIALTPIPAGVATSGAHIFIWEPLHTATSNLYVVTNGTCHFLASFKGTTAFPAPLLHNQTLHLVHRNSIVTVDVTGNKKIQKTSLNLQGRLLGNVQCLGDRYHHMSYGYKGSIYRVLLNTDTKRYCVVPKRDDDGYLVYCDGEWKRYFFSPKFWAIEPLSPVSM
ncbi:hypothetical protein B0I72DRAFT_176369 [Yarrowia lipolytica]|jgi:hypothetical protein|uniref:Uncharacterized protein n=1 Tax=Yarrowia lipolytica TaxID=4952 RepID=A0A371C8H5_YARLL|nr:hypothetical protein B0I71DRAFT_96752 [Yarrowia lipolytica]RDW30438.1 hypothetical protein B0I72DRAFT_176369 [Yarrowia lipolytica]RDW39484.1 hypothetical protein B0I73DRAFT_175030 [Yarrowia lipolytica]RDW44882.1 hypothetical protein B0I74DRAFT_114817 [Yarrowia lipolytica]RDW51710.1 hypothetical protein B0I75DRAFT_120492 [Yarrowia lipolytica]